MHQLVLLAKSAVENYIKENKIISSLEDLPEEFLKRRAGTFVTIEKAGELRGCIGTYLPTRINIVEEIIHNAIAAATEDYRFGPIQKEELPYLSYTVYILSYPEPVKNIKELDPRKFGIIVKTGPFTYPSGSEGEKREQFLFDLSNEKEVTFDGVIPYKTGLLLPDLEGVDTIEQQIEICCQKGGINPQREKIFIYKFTVEKYQ
jgi:AmmeMemoRadiSam system protein A